MSARSRNGTAALSQQEREEAMEKLASNLLAAGAGAVLTTRWPVHTQRTTGICRAVLSRSRRWRFTWRGHAAGAH